MPPKFDKILSKASRDQLFIAASDLGLKIGEGSTLKDLQKCVKEARSAHISLLICLIHEKIFIKICRFTPTMFGQLEEMSGDNDCLTVGCPNWSASGWSEQYFVAHFQEQLLGLRETESKIQENSPGTEYVKNWTPNMFGDNNTGSKLESDIMGGWCKRIFLDSTVAIEADFICGGDGPGVKITSWQEKSALFVQQLREGRTRRIRP
ncbi:hypothetical protein B0H13DRAFT_1853541 [Mycena leptocephala]|nr:hypothetical protein B0H13DRAFT_1875047 [Mycena leptocephala]KAJ7936476.1 hypothetical protein B0H13DRAFT_1853541 [Mycena leptocephala]